MMLYVTYDANGELTGAFQQDLRSEHAACHIEVSEPELLNWVGYRANADRSGLETKPPAPPVVIITQTVSRRQGRLALLENTMPNGVNMLDGVEAAIAAIADPIQRRAAQIEYEADTWDRSNAFLQQMWLGLGGDMPGLDALFILADTK